MSILTRKLLRNLTERKGQFIAVAAVVAIGIMLYIALSVSYQNLRDSQQDFYEEKHFADYYFQVVKAPDRILKQIENVAGAARVTGRITEDLPIVKADGSRATARVVTYDMEDKNSLNMIHMVGGRIFSSSSPSGEIEAVVDPQFMAGNNLDFGDTVSIVNEGRRINIRVVGTAIGPEFIYIIKDLATMFPDPQTFGVFMLPNRQAQQVLNMSGQINQVLLDFNPGIDEKAAVNEIEDILAPYGVLASYPRADQISHSMLEAEIDGLKSVVSVLPIIFLGIAAAIQFVILRRMIKTQRMQIGIMKALGYNNREIKGHYIVYSLLVGILGALLGTVFGLAMSGYITEMFAMYFNLPEKVLGYNLSVIGYAFLLSTLVSVTAGWSAAGSVTRIQPAESMRPETPKIGSRSWLESLESMWARLTPQWKMSLRSIHRNRGRFLVTLAGVISAVTLMMMAWGTNDSVNYMMARHFDLDRKYDLQVNFTSPVKMSDLIELDHLPGVLQVEGFFELPVKLHYKGKSENELLAAYPRDVTLKSMFDAGNNPIKVPEAGIVVNKNTAAKLGVAPGDEVTVETLLPMGPNHFEKTRITGLNTQMFGGNSYINIEEANRFIKEAQLVTGAMIKIEPGRGAAVEEEINKMMQVASMQNREKERQNILTMMGPTISMVGLMILFALILGFAIIYNSSTIGFNEREQELASLKVLGFTSREVSQILLKENILQCIAGIIIGLPAGGFLTKAYLTSMSNDLYDMPAAVYPLSYFWSVLGAVVFVFVAHRLAVRGIEKLNLVEVLKNRD